MILIMSKKINISKDFLYQEYTFNKKSMQQIAEETGCSYSCVHYNLIKNNIKPRSKSEANKDKNNKYSNILTKSFLIKEYIIIKKSTAQIAKEVGCSQVTILNYLIKYNITRRNQSGTNKGKNHWNFKGSQAITRQIYYCKEKWCDNKISYSTWKQGQRRCLSCNNKNKWANQEYKKKVSKAISEGRIGKFTGKNSSFFGKHHTKESKQKMRKKRALAIKNGNYNLSPNKPEKLLIKFLNKILPKQYKFVGDGKLTVGGFIPDFVNKDNNKIIEHYGTFWHNLPEYKKRDKLRIVAYKKANYKTLIIWQHELKDLDKLENKIINFNKV